MVTGRLPERRVLVGRKAMNDVIRRLFDDLGFLEVETPIAVASPGLEPHLVAFALRDGRHLHTSPEYAMKKMLGRGVGHIYQLARVFRDEPWSPNHAPEFTMLEWYRCPGRITEIMDDVEALIETVAGVLKGPWRPRGFERISVSKAFLRVGLPDPLDFEDPRALKDALGVFAPPGSEDTWDDVFFRAFLDKVEPSFPEDKITILHSYPARMAALAQLDRTDPRCAERFEVYAGRLELANAFGELTDPVEQRARFEDDLRAREKLGRPPYIIDEELLADLPGIAARGGAAGIALGVDRLLMLCLGVASIHEVMTFSPEA